MDELTIAKQYPFEVAVLQMPGSQKRGKSCTSIPRILAEASSFRAPVSIVQIGLLIALALLFELI